MRESRNDEKGPCRGKKEKRKDGEIDDGSKETKMEVKEGRKAKREGGKEREKGIKGVGGGGRNCVSLRMM